MARINSKNKGSTFERKVAKILTSWSGMEFHRTPGSGSLHWKVDNNVSGDIVAPFEINFPISIECKKHEIDWEVDKLLVGTSTLWKFWNQSCEDSLRHKAKEPWVIFTKNNRKIYIIMNYSYYMQLASKKIKLKKNPYINIVVEDKNIIITDLELFLSIVSIQDLL